MRFVFWVSHTAVLFFSVVSLFILPSSLFAADESGEVHLPFVLVKVPDLQGPKKIEAYVSFETPYSFKKIRGVYMEQAEEADTSFVWGAYLPTGSSSPEVVALVVEDGAEKEKFFTYKPGEFSYYSPQGSEEVRESISLLREEVGQAKKEKQKWQANLNRLEEDARLIGGFQEVEELEKKKSFEDGELRRIRSQVSQLKKSLEALKQWKDPADLVERKRVLIKEIQELQKN